MRRALSICNSTVVLRVASAAATKVYEKVCGITRVYHCKKKVCTTKRTSIYTFCNTTELEESEIISLFEVQFILSVLWSFNYEREASKFSWNFIVRIYDKIHEYESKTNLQQYTFNVEYFKNKLQTRSTNSEEFIYLFIYRVPLSSVTL